MFSQTSQNTCPMHLHRKYAYSSSKWYNISVTMRDRRLVTIDHIYRKPYRPIVSLWVQWSRDQWRHVPKTEIKCDKMSTLTLFTNNGYKCWTKNVKCTREHSNGTDTSFNSRYSSLKYKLNSCVVYNALQNTVLTMTCRPICR